VALERGKDLDAKFALTRQGCKILTISRTKDACRTTGGDVALIIGQICAVHLNTEILSDIGMQAGIELPVAS